MEMNIEGIGLANIQYTEYVSAEILKRYTQYIAIIKTVLDKRPINSIMQITAADYENLEIAIQGLAVLAKNGLTDNDGSGDYQSYITNTMGDQINQVMKTLKIVGIPSSTPLTDSEKIQKINNWQSLAGFGVEEIVQEALLLERNTRLIYDPTKGVSVAAPINRSLQSMIELEYIKTSNDFIGTQLSSLSGALDITREVVDTLTTVQHIYNQIAIDPVGQFTYPPTKNGDVSLIAWKKMLATQGPYEFINSLSTIFVEDRNTSNQVYAEFVHDWDIATGGSGNTLSLGSDSPSSHPGLIITTVPAVTQNLGGLPPQIITVTPAKKVITINFDATVNMTTFNNLQAASNSISATSGGYVSFYKILASASFSQIFPDALPLPTSPYDLWEAKVKLSKDLALLVQQNPTQGPTSVSTMGGRIYTVIQNISAVFSHALANPSTLFTSDPSQFNTSYTNAVKQWILDAQDLAIGQVGLVGTAGTIQKNITYAIQSAESLNDDQRDAVRRYVLIFEEFYKTASSMLENLTNAIEKFNHGIKKGK